MSDPRLLALVAAMEPGEDIDEKLLPIEAMLAGWAFQAPPQGSYAKHLAKASLGVTALRERAEKAEGNARELLIAAKIYRAAVDRIGKAWDQWENGTDDAISEEDGEAEYYAANRAVDKAQKALDERIAAYLRGETPTGDPLHHAECERHIDRQAKRCDCPHGWPKARSTP